MLKPIKDKLFILTILSLLLVHVKSNCNDSCYKQSYGDLETATIEENDSKSDTILRLGKPRLEIFLNCLNECAKVSYKAAELDDNHEPFIYKKPKSGIYCVGSGTETCYKKCRLIRKENEETCICACCANKYKKLCKKH